MYLDILVLIDTNLKKSVIFESRTARSRVKNEIKTLLLKCQKNKKNKKTMGIITSLITKGLMPSVISGGAGLLGGAINAGSQLGTNSSQLSYAKEMYDKQRADALADWDRQNLYNSPKEQMARFKEAGLNPNLIYGQMSNSPAVRSSSPQSYSPTAPQIDLTRPAGMALDAYYDTQLKAAQVDNVKAMIDGVRQDNLLKGFELLKRTADSKFYEGTARTNYNKLVNEAALSMDELDKMRPKQRDLMDSQIKSQNSQRNLNQAQQANVEQTLNNLKSEDDLKQLEIKLKQWEVDHQDITNIINYGAKLLSMIPGGSIIERFLPKKTIIQNTYKTLKGGK